MSFCKKLPVIIFRARITCTRLKYAEIHFFAGIPRFSAIRLYEVKEGLILSKNIAYRYYVYTHTQADIHLVAEIL